MCIVFFGTPDYVLPILKALVKGYEIAAVVTQPPRPVGRKQFKQFSPVDDWAHKRSLATSGGKRKIPVLFDFAKIPQADLGVCAAYGKIIPQFVINRFKFGILNIHPSLLPQYRGASPTQTAILNNETETGVTIIRMDDQIDHGPILTQFREEILPDDTNDSLRSRLFARSAQVLVALLPAYLKGKVKEKTQDESQASSTKVIGKQDGFVDLKKDDPVQIGRKLRALTPWPGIWTILEGKRLKILKAHLEENKLILDEVQLEGKNPVAFKQFKEAYPQISF